MQMGCTKSQQLMGCTNLEVLLAESLVRVDGLGLGQLLDRRRPHGLNTTSILVFLEQDRVPFS